MEYFLGRPFSRDAMWSIECASVREFCVGKGLDPGAGGRTFSPEMVRMDVMANHCPQVRGSAMHLPFRDQSFDFVFTVHLIEHMPDPRAAIAEWMRVVRVGGHVVMIVPNTLYTLGQNTDATAHHNEWTPREFVEKVLLKSACAGSWFTARHALDWLPAKIVHCDQACPQWSFAVVLRKEAEC